MMDIDKIRPYENNPRDNSLSVGKVAESIKEFGFLQPIVIDSDGIILAGHTRYKAAKLLGLRDVPVIEVKDLSPAQAKAYRLADNKAGEDSKWLADLLSAELNEIELDSDIDMGLLGFDNPKEYEKKASWIVTSKLCDLKKQIMAREKAGFFYTSFFKTGKNGRAIDEIKEDEKMVRPFALNLVDYIEGSLGNNLKLSDWCIATMPRRRHKEGFHFATEICKAAASLLGIEFREGIVTAKNRVRIAPEFNLAEDPPEKNIILYDDIITTGMTIKETRRILIEAGHSVLSVIAIRN